METPEHAGGQPLEPTAERSDPAAEPLPAGVLCFRCRYDLGGLTLHGVCPECGLGVLASRPAWDLRACDTTYVEQAREEVSGARLALQLAFTAALTGALLSLLVSWSRRATVFEVPVVLLALTTGALVLGVLIALGVLAAAMWRVHPVAARVAGGAWALLRWGVWTAGAALVAGYAVVVLGFAAYPIVGPAALLAGVTAACIGIGLLCVGASMHARGVRGRAGRASTGRRPAWLPAPLAALAAIGPPLSPALGVSVPVAIATALAVMALPIAITLGETNRAGSALEGMESKIA